MIADISPVVEKLFFSNHVYSSFTGESVVDGEVTLSYAADSSLFCGVIPMNGKELKSLPEGQFTLEDVNILVKGDSPLKLKDRITKNGSIYEIKIELDVSDLVGIKKFVGKKLL